MSKQVLKRLSFTAGELSPWLQGRTDLDPVARGAAKLQNFLVMPFGGLKRRPGTALVSNAAATQGVVRLMTFKYSDGDQYILELGRGYLRIFKNAALLTDAQGNVLEIATPWQTDEQLRQLRLQQLNDVIYCVESQSPPMTLSRHADDDWRLETFTITGMPFESYLLNSVGLECRTVLEDGVLNTYLTADADVFTPDMANKELLRITRKYGEAVKEADLKPSTQVSSLNRIFYPGDTFYLLRDGWAVAYTCIQLFNNETDYIADEDNPEAYPLYFQPGADACSQVLVNGTWTLETTGTWDAEWEIYRGYPDGPNYLPANPELIWHSVKSFYQKDGYRNNFALSGHEDEPCYYKVRLMTWRYGGQTGVPVLRAGAHSFNHELRVREVHSARKARVSDAFRWFGSVLPDCDTHDWSFAAFGVRNGYPSTVEFFQGRLWFAGTPGQPQTVWGSRVDEFTSFTPGEAADAALILTMAASQQNRVAWLASLRGMVLGTEEGEWRLKAADSGSIHANNAEFERHSGVGSTSLDVLTVENSLLFVQRGGAKVRELYYSFEVDGFQTRDVSLLAEHLPRAGIVDWCVQQSYAFQVWCVLGDGSAVCMTLSREQNIVAWHAHRIEQGKILSVTAIRGDNNTIEEVWFAVARGEGEHALITLERMAEGNDYMDAAMSIAVHDGVAVAPSYMTDRDCYALNGEGAFVLVHPDGAGRLLCPEYIYGDSVKIGLPAVAELRTMPLETTETMGMFKKQLGARVLLLDSSLAFYYGTGHESAWRAFQPERYQLNAPYSGYVRMTHNYGTDEQCSFALRIVAPAPFNLLALVPEVDL